MCGIGGIIRRHGVVDQQQLDQLTDALAHRGPDGRGTYIHQSVGLGHRRLAILDLSNAGRQPMSSDDGMITLSYNGEIYNFKQKRAELERRGYTFRSSCDTEVVLRLYEEYGPSCVTHLRGMFAFAIHDRKNNTVFLARDRLGKKPIKYFYEQGVFAFASELKALRTLPECPTEIDQESVHHFLTMMYLPAPLTGMVGIHKLPAAHTLTFHVDSGKIDINRYWELQYDTDSSTSKQEWIERIRSGLTDSVSMRMVADVPVGAFLSGGVDSAAIVATMAGLSPSPVQTFSIGSRTNTHNELPDAERIAKLYNTDHHPIVLEPDIVTLLPQLVSTYEEPYADPSSIPTYLVAQEARKYVTVALNGDGGDENFAGYVRYPIARFSERYARLPSAFHSLMNPLTSAFHAVRQNTFSYRVKRFQQSMHLPFDQRYLQYLSFFTEEEKRMIEHHTYDRTDVWYANRTSAARSRAHDVVHTAMSMDVETYLADDLLPKVDMSTMAHGLEARSPLLDHEFMEMTARIPTEYLLRGRKGKCIFKEALHELVPHQTLYGRKRGFRLPLDTWFRNDLRSYVDETILDAPEAYWQMFDRTGVEKFLQSYHQSSIDYSDHVWALLWLSQWYAQYN